MTVPYNPYAPPSASTLPPLPPGAPLYQGCWRDGKTLIMTPGAPLLERCVKCNRPAELPIKSRTVYWHSPWVYLALLFNILIFIIIAMVVRKKAIIAPGLCAEHRQVRLRYIALGWLGALAGIGLIAFGFSGDSSAYGVMILIGFLLFFVTIIAGALGARILYPVKIEPHQVRLRGAGDAFLANFPELPPGALFR